MFELKDLQNFFDEAKDNHIAFEGLCHDCEKEVTVNIDMTDEGLVSVNGGAIYRPKKSSS